MDKNSSAFQFHGKQTHLTHTPKGACDKLNFKEEPSRATARTPTGKTPSDLLKSNGNL